MKADDSNSSLSKLHQWDSFTTKFASTCISSASTALAKEQENFPGSFQTVTDQILHVKGEKNEKEIIGVKMPDQWRASGMHQRKTED